MMKTLLEQDCAVSFALGTALNGGGVAKTRARAFQDELDRQGFMVVRKDYRAEGLAGDILIDPVNNEIVDDEDALIDEADIGQVVEIGRAMRLPSRFVVRHPIGQDETDVARFDTRAAAGDFINQMNGPEER